MLKHKSLPTIVTRRWASVDFQLDQTRMHFEDFFSNNRHELTNQLQHYFTSLQQFEEKRIVQPVSSSLTSKTESILLHLRRTHGFYCFKAKSSVPHPNSGFGVFVNSSRTIEPGEIVCLYPGTVYFPLEPLFFASIGNKFINRRTDGVMIDGNDRFLSKWIHKSCVERENAGNPYAVADYSWLHFYQHARGNKLEHESLIDDIPLHEQNYEKFPVKNPMAIGHYINSPGDGQTANMMYYEYDFEDLEWPLPLRQFIPHVHYQHNTMLRTYGMVMIAIREIKHGDELLASYFNYVINKKQ